MGNSKLTAQSTRLALTNCIARHPRHPFYLSTQVGSLIDPSAGIGAFVIRYPHPARYFRRIGRAVRFNEN